MRCTKGAKFPTRVTGTVGSGVSTWRPLAKSRCQWREFGPRETRSVVPHHHPLITRRSLSDLCTLHRFEEIGANIYTPRCSPRWFFKQITGAAPGLTRAVGICQSSETFVRLKASSERLDRQTDGKTSLAKRVLYLPCLCQPCDPKLGREPDFQYHNLGNCFT